MEIKFEIKSEEAVEIVNKANGQVVGRMFTPSGTMKDREGAVQICGFDDCFGLWGCGIFGDGEGNPKKDIQLLFNENSRRDGKVGNDIITVDKCGKCFHYYRDEHGDKNKDGKCRCDDLRNKTFKEIVVDKLDWKDKRGAY